jgi:hypothetical protein
MARELSIAGTTGVIAFRTSVPDAASREMPDPL